MYFIRIILFLILACFLQCSFGVDLGDTSQLLVVTAATPNTSTGLLQRYEKNSKLSWQAIGSPIPVVLGKNGMTKSKQEGDLKTPEGIYKIGPAFGFSEKALSGMKLPYTALKTTSICVDDSKSKYYGQLINSDEISHPDWTSGEEMRAIPLYQWGALVQYNMNPAVPGAGSCIFLHIWRAPNKGTAGCVAMAKQNLEQVLRWLNSQNDPRIVILTNSDLNKFIQELK